MTFNIHEAKTQLSKLIQAAEEGKEIVICRHGTPVARLVAFKSALRPIGIWEDKGWVAEDFTALPHDVEKTFYGDAD